MKKASPGFPKPAANPSVQRALETRHPYGRHAGMTFAEILDRPLVADPWLFFAWITRNVRGPSGDAACVLLEHYPLELAA